ncbi:Transforming growth factor-beta, C-terminal,Cystine-knot cytokine,Transforming growth factor [Cinara cedri]|uniref:Transforming growth factor-beta, C-terminal,Cystine-knot cytokine,Transforming growth factor n=1 Tax=Cinara cedri TaxID=506608 RepID=A0A5E4N899_9HEMI|nr:Transforming growth factor-beta, C-terminal,Cystine-knot cytokine,Transforming growth factor [Cinara cedri]
MDVGCDSLGCNTEIDTLRYTDINDGEGVKLRATITFPIGRAIANGYGPMSIKSVVRIYGKQLVGSSFQEGSGDGSGDGSSSRDISGSDVSSSEFGDAVQASVVPVRVYGRRVSSDGASREKPSLVTVLTFPTVGRGRWRDVDVTRLLKARKPHVANVAEEPTTLELSLWYPTASETIQISGGCDGCHADRLPVMHCFLDGNLEYSMWPLGDVEPIRCTGLGTIRKKRDGIAAVKGGGRGRKDKRRRPSVSGSVRRTDCKVDQSSMVGTNNGTNKCCREQMRVVFADIPGFDFIIEPKWFDAGLCRGRCPAKYNPATRHAFIQSLLNNNRGVADSPRNRRQRRRVRHGGEKESREATGVVSPWIPSIPRPSPPKPCCAPSMLDKLEIMHVDEVNPKKLTVTRWKEMVVVECACS